MTFFDFGGFYRAVLSFSLFGDGPGFFKHNGTLCQIFYRNFFIIQNSFYIGFIPANSTFDPLGGDAISIIHHFY